MVRKRTARLAGSVGRIAAALAVLAALAPWPITPAPAALADEPLVFVSSGPDALLQGGDPVARLQVIIKSIYVSNDRESWIRGDADIKLTASFWRCSSPQPPCSAEGNPATLLAYASKSFDAGEGDTETLNRLIPLAGDVRDAGVASEEAGIAVHAGQRYLFMVDAFEDDWPAGGDFMGGIQRAMTQSNNWGIGVYTKEVADHFAESVPPTPDDLLCAGCGGIVVGDYLVTYEIRKTALADLHPKTMKVIDGAAGSDDAVCVDVENRGQQESADFYVSLYVDNSLPPNGNLEAAGLGPGESRESCIRTTLPTSGRHSLRAIVDQYRYVPEMDETNNAIDRGLLRTPLGQTGLDDLPEAVAEDSGPNSSPVPPSRIIDPVIVTDTATIGTSPPGPILTAPAPSHNLEIKAIRVKGKEPSGQNDCDPGENDVTVVIKNEGNAAAASLLVRLSVGDQTKDKTATDLGAGSEVNISFDDLMLTKGQHKMTATANVPNPAAMVTQDDGKLEVTVGCADE